jgi:hypothetical protein
MIIFVVSGNINYDTSTALKAFSNKESAKQFVKICEEYDKAQPSTYTGREIWISNHPAKDWSFDSYDSYEIAAIELDT